MRGLSPAAASGGHSSSPCAGLSLSRPPLLRSTGSRRTGSAVVAHGPSRSTACGILPDQGWNPCPLHRQADSQPLRHQGSPAFLFLILILFIVLYSRFLLIIYFKHISVYMSIPVSTTTHPPRFPPLVSIHLFSTSVSLFLPCKPVHLYHFSRFHIYVLIYNICFSLSDVLHSV